MGWMKVGEECGRNARNWTLRERLMPGEAWILWDGLGRGGNLWLRFGKRIRRVVGCVKSVAGGGGGNGGGSWAF